MAPGGVEGGPVVTIRDARWALTGRPILHLAGLAPVCCLDSLHLEGRDYGKGCEVAIVVEHGEGVSQGARGDEAVDAGANRHPGPASGSVEIDGYFEDLVSEW